MPVGVDSLPNAGAGNPYSPPPNTPAPTPGQGWQGPGGVNQGVSSGGPALRSQGWYANHQGPNGERTSPYTGPAPEDKSGAGGAGGDTQHSQGWINNRMDPQWLASHPGAQALVKQLQDLWQSQGGMIPRPGDTNSGNEIRPGMTIQDWRNKMQGGGSMANPGDLMGPLSGPMLPPPPPGGLIPRPGSTDQGAAPMDYGSIARGWGGPGGVNQGVGSVPNMNATPAQMVNPAMPNPNQLAPPPPPMGLPIMPNAQFPMLGNMGLPASNPMAQQMNALLNQQLMMQNAAGSGNRRA